MGCCSRRVKQEDLRPEQKWDFISLNDFKNTNCFTPFAYGYLWISLFISVAVYGVDTFTAVNLLVFNKWAGEIQPKISFDISKWIFSACIILSWVNVGYEHIRAMRVMKRGAVAESFMDSLAVRLQCTRLGKGRGWKRFLVFAELTKSKKGAEYVALFTYFSFQSWFRIIFCQGPRQVINAITLYAVFQANFEAKSDVGSSLTTLFTNIGHLAEQSHQQALVLSGMIFTLVIWVFGALSLILASLFYVFFLWHYIPNRDGGLSGYCERKVDKRLSSIVSVKVNKAIEEEERRRLKLDAKSLRKGEKPAGRQATLPTLFDAKVDDKLPQMPGLQRIDTMQTLPLYTSRPGTPSSQQPTLPDFELEQLQNRPFPKRDVTGSSKMSYASNAPLIGNASDMGYRQPSPVRSLPPLDTNGYPLRPMTSGSNRSQWSAGPGGPPGMPPRMLSAMGDRGYTQSPVSYVDGRSTPGGPIMSGQGIMDEYGPPISRAVGEIRSNTPAGAAPSMGRRTPFDPNIGRSSPAPMLDGRNPPAPMNGGYLPYNQGMAGSDERSSPAPTINGFNQGNGRNSPAPGLGMNNGYNPGMRSASVAPQSHMQNGPRYPQRNMTGPNNFGDMPRPGTGDSMQAADIARFASPAPYNNGGSPGFGPMTPGNAGYRRS